MLRLDGENFDNILNKMDYIEIYICKHLNHVFKKKLKRLYSLYNRSGC